MDEPHDYGDIKYLGNGKFILKAFKNIWFNKDGSEINPLKFGPPPPQKTGKYTCEVCQIRTDCEKCPICSRNIVPKKVET